MRLLFSILFGVSIVLAYGTLCAEELTIKPNWKVGDKRTYEIVKSFEYPREKLKIVTRYSINIEVTKASENSISVIFSHGELTFDNEANDNVETKNLLKKIVIEAELNSDGAISEFINGPAILKAVPNQIAYLVEIAKRRTRDNEEIRKIDNFLRSSITTEELAITLIEKDAQYLFLHNGLKMDPRLPLDFEDAIPNPIGGDPYPVVCFITMDEPDAKTGLVNFSYSKKFDKKKFGPILEKSLESLFGKTGQKLPEIQLADLRSYSITEHSSHTYDVNSTWMKHVKQTKTIQSVNSHIIESLELTLKP